MVRRMFMAALAASFLVALGSAPAAAQSPQTAPGTQTKKPAPSTQAKKPDGETKKKRALTPGQQAARERQKKCGAEWKAAKASGKISKDMRWPQYWSECNKRLKTQGT